MRALPAIPSSNARGFTLMELLIAIFILGVVLTTIYSAYSGTMRVVKEIDDDARAYKMARITLDRMTRDMSSLQRFSTQQPNQQPQSAFIFQSERKTIERREFSSLYVWSAGHLAFDEGEVPGRPASIAYFVKEDREKIISLWRSDVAGTKPSADKKNEGGVIICENLQSLKLKFYDENGRDYESWDTDASTEPQKGKPPAAVQIELMLLNPRDAEKPYTFMTKIALPVRK